MRLQVKRVHINVVLSRLLALIDKGVYDAHNMAVLSFKKTSHEGQCLEMMKKMIAFLSILASPFFQVFD